jgi:type VI secretion system protein ImpE
VLAQQLYQAGRLPEAQEALVAALRADPMDVRSRTFLFELLCFAGEWDRAERQLDVLADASREAALGALLYRSALHGERTRQDMFLAVLVPPPPAAVVSGTLNGRRFESMTDADPRIGPRLEVFAAGQYTLLPLAGLAELKLEEPRLLRDLIWPTGRPRAGAGLNDFDFGEIIVPALAPLTWRHDDWQVRLGREVDWVVLDDGMEVPVGPKLLQVDDELIPLLDVRELIIDSPPG